MTNSTPRNPTAHKFNIQFHRQYHYHPSLFVIIILPICHQPSPCSCIIASLLSIISSFVIGEGDESLCSNEKKKKTSAYFISIYLLSMFAQFNRKREGQWYWLKTKHRRRWRWHDKTMFTDDDTTPAPRSLCVKREAKFCMLNLKRLNSTHVTRYNSLQQSNTPNTTHFYDFIFIFPFADDDRWYYFVLLFQLKANNCPYWRDSLWCIVYFV